MLLDQNRQDKIIL